MDLRKAIKMKDYIQSNRLREGIAFGRRGSVFNVLMLAFLIFNLVIRFSTIFYYPPYNAYIAGFFGGIVSCCIWVVFSPKYLRDFYFYLGFRFFSLDLGLLIFKAGFSSSL